MIFFDGFDVTKEIQYFKGIPDLAPRGIGRLIVDGPGNGEAIRFRNRPLHHETGRYATAAYEYLAARPEIDRGRIGVMAISLGGYFAPRAAAFEPRFAVCIAWGAQWGPPRRLEGAPGPHRPRRDALALRAAWEHLLWIFAA